jgi:outer membrane protein
MRWMIVPALAATCLWWTGCALWPLPERYDTYPAPLPGRPPAAPVEGPWASEVQVAPEGPLQLSVEDAILLALDNNRQYRVQRIKPDVTRTQEDVERAAFDPTVSGTASVSRSKAVQTLTTGGTQKVTTTQNRVSAGVTQLLPTGTGVQVQASESRTQSLATLGNSNQYQFRAGLTVTQALLRGYGVEVNLANLRQARIDTVASEYELRGFAEDLVAGTEETYWNYALAVRSIRIFQDSVDLARKQLSDAQERVRVGKLAASELAPAQAELARRQEDLINARSDMEKTRLKVLQFVSPKSVNLLGRQISLLDQPAMDEQEVGPVEDHIQLALRMRPELNQARLQVKRGDLDVVKTASGLLPKLDGFIQLGKSGYGSTFTSAFTNLRGKNYDALAGVNFEYPPANREARANHQAAILNRSQAVEAVANLEQSVEVDVRSAYIEVERAREQVAATRATREYREETLRAEVEKFNVGKSTSFLVAQAQRDLVGSQIDEIQAVVSHLNALAELYRLEGSLLLRRGINAPGEKPEDIQLP